MKALLYCNKQKPYLMQGFAKPNHSLDSTNPLNYNFIEINKLTSACLNGKVVAEIDYEVVDILWCYEPLCVNHRLYYLSNYDISNHIGLIEGSKMTPQEIHDYLKGKDGKAYIIKDIKVYTTPYILYNMKKPHKKVKLYSEFSGEFELKVLTCNPEELCRILNGEQTIIIRKR